MTSSPGRWAGLGVAVGMAAVALFSPSLASGSARTTVGSGRALAGLSRPLIARLPMPFGGPASFGSAAITIDAASGEVCGDLHAAALLGGSIGSRSTSARIHRKAASGGGPAVAELVPPNPTSASCVFIAPAIATEILMNPGGFYVEVQTTAVPAATSGQLSDVPRSSGALILLDEPLRAYDSREVLEPTSHDGPFDPRIKPGETLLLSLAQGKNSAGVWDLAVPPGASGALIRVTVDQTVGRGYLSVYSAALATPPVTATVNWYEAGAIVGADSTIAVDSLRNIKVTGAVNPTHFIIDVFGYIF